MADWPELWTCSMSRTRRVGDPWERERKVDVFNLYNIYTQVLCVIPVCVLLASAVPVLYLARPARRVLLCGDRCALPYACRCVTCVECACSAGAVGSFSNKPLSPNKPLSQKRNYIYMRTALLCMSFIFFSQNHRPRSAYIRVSINPYIRLTCWLPRLHPPARSAARKALASAAPCFASARTRTASPSFRCRRR